MARYLDNDGNLINSDPEMTLKDLKKFEKKLKKIDEIALCEDIYDSQCAMKDLIKQFNKHIGPGMFNFVIYLHMDSNGKIAIDSEGSFSLDDTHLYKMNMLDEKNVLENEIQNAIDDIRFNYEHSSYDVTDKNKVALPFLWINISNEYNRARISYMYASPQQVLHEIKKWVHDIVDKKRSIEPLDEFDELCDMDEAEILEDDDQLKMVRRFVYS